MNNILVATDFSERSDRALRRASLLARQRNARLTLLHVVDDDQPQTIVKAEQQEAAALLEQTAATLQQHDALQCQTRLVLGSPFAGITSVAASIKPDLLVIGSHRRQILREVFVGTTAERTIRTAVCPVLMVNASPTTNYQHIMRTSALTGLVGINTPFDPPTQGSTQTCHRCEGIGQDQNKNVV